MTRSGIDMRVLIEDKYEGSYSYLSLTPKYTDVTLLLSEVNGMAISTGTPVLKLDRQNHFGKKDKHSGNAQAVLEEMFPDEEGIRHSADEDYNPELTANNLFFEYDYEMNSFKSRKQISSKEVVDKYYSEAEAYKITDKNGKERSLRDDAVICVAGIIKPSMDSEEWQDYSDEQKIKYLEIAMTVQTKLLQKRGIQVEYATVHMDEANPHIHWVGKDKTYQMGKKVGLPLFRDFNEKMPKELTKLGYATKVLASFDKDAYDQLSDDEKTEYIKHKKAHKKKANQESNDYKMQRKLEEAKAVELKETREKKAEYEKLVEQGTIAVQLANEYEKKIEKYAELVNSMRKTFNQTLKDTNEIKNEILAEKVNELQATVEAVEALEIPEKPEPNEFTKLVEARAEHYEEVVKEDGKLYVDDKKPVKKKPVNKRVTDVIDTSWKDDYQKQLKEIQASL